MKVYVLDFIFGTISKVNLSFCNSENSALILGLSAPRVLYSEAGSPYVLISVLINYVLVLVIC
jgi:hypothetical protein